jgi:hypothetical protein
MAFVTTQEVAQDIYVLHSLTPTDKLSVTMARLPYTMLTKVMALAYGNNTGMFKSDREADTLELNPDYEVSKDLVSDEIITVTGQMIEMAYLYATAYEEHVSVGQFCVWAQVGPEFFPLIREYAKRFEDEAVTFYSLENPYSTRSHEEEFIATPDTRDAEWGAKQFQPPKAKNQKQANKAKNKRKN